MNSTFFTPDSRLSGNEDVLPAMCLKQMMMKRIACLLFFCYALILIRPAVPVFGDMLAHTFFEQQHLMAVHEEHGKFHIHYEVQKQSQENSKGRWQLNSKYSDNECLCVRLPDRVSLPTHCYAAQVFTKYRCYYPVAFLEKEYIPPQA